MKKLSARNSWLFKNINKPVTRLTRKHREKTQITDLRGGRGNIATDLTAIPRTVRKRYKQRHARELDT